MGEAPQVLYVNGYSTKFGHQETDLHQNNLNGNGHSHEEDDTWYKEVIDDDLKLSFALNNVLHQGISGYVDDTSACFQANGHGNKRDKILF